jgi:hypothetical protein
MLAKTNILIIFILLLASCGVQKLSDKDCSEKRAIKVYVLPFRLDEHEFDTYKEIEEDLLKMCYSVITVSKTLSGDVIPKEAVYKRVKDSLGINLYEKWRLLNIDEIQKIGELINVDYIVKGNTSAKPAYQSTEFFTNTEFINIRTGKKETMYRDKFIGKIIYNSNEQE